MVTPENVGFLPESMGFFRRLGFGVVLLHLETYAIWDQAAARHLKVVLRKFRADFLKTLEQETAGCCGTRFLFSQSGANDYREIIGKAVSLAFDGCFYPCDFSLIPPLRKELCVGDLENGIDLRRIEKIVSLPMFARISRKCRHRDGLRSPVERYYWGLAHKYSGGRLGENLEDTSRVNRLFDEEMGGCLRLRKIYERLVIAPAFGDFVHSPKHKGVQEIKMLRLALSDRSDIVKLRAAIDFFLYSPGNRKTLLLDATDNGRETIDIVEGMVFYSLVKAGKGHLNKKLRLLLETAARGSDRDSWRYLDDYGVQVGIKAAAGSGPREDYKRNYSMDKGLNRTDSTYAVIGVDRWNARDIAGLVRAAVKNSCGWARLELCGKGAWSAEDLAGLRAGLTGLSEFLLTGILKGRPVYLLNFEEEWSSDAGGEVFPGGLLADAAGNYVLVPRQWRCDGRGVKIGHVDTGLKKTEVLPGGVDYDAGASREFADGLGKILESARYLAKSKPVLKAYLDRLLGGVAGIRAADKQKWLMTCRR